MATLTMDKQTFLDLAPEYYMLALYEHLQYPRDYYTDASWRKDFTFEDQEVREEYCYIEIAALRAEAVRLMVKYEAITVIEDPFGPTIWQKTENLEPLIERLENSPASAFFRAKVSGDPKSWLRSALQSVNHGADELEITRADFETAETVADVWEPITLDQTAPSVVEATKQLNVATEAVEQDNGYSVTHPQERDAVVGDLKGGLEKLKSGVISGGWMRRTIEALKIASARFAGTIKGQMIDGALTAVKEVVKSHMGQALEWLLRLLP